MSFELIKHYEGLHDGDLSQIGLQPKMDPVGIWTEGWGHAMVGPDGKFIKGVANKKMAYSLAKIKTIEDADKQLLIDIKPVLLTIQRKVTVELNESQTNALASFVYNTGGSSTLFNLINSKSKLLFDWWCKHYVCGQGNPTPLKGLVARRHTEALLFTDGKLQYFN